MIDDSALLHGQGYDPRKAHEYYLRTRHLKGRRSGGQSQASGGRPSAGGTSNSHLRASQREHLLAEKKKLENRLEYLKQLLEEAVNAAKKRSGVKEKPADTTSTASKDKAGKKGTPDKPLTEAEKRKKREDSRKRYQEEKKTSLSQDVAELHRQVQDIRAKLEAAYKNARERSSQSTHKTAPQRR